MTDTTTKCTYCGKPAEKVVKREIHDRSRDPYTNRPCVRTRTMDFAVLNAAAATKWAAKADGPFH